MDRVQLDIDWSPVRLNQFYLAFCVLPVLVFLGIYVISGRLRELSVIVQYPDSLLILLIWLLMAISHELLHYLALVFRRVATTAVRIKFDRAALSPYIVIGKEVSINTWRICLVAPAAVLIPLFLAGLFITEHTVQAGLLLAMTVSACAYDIALLIALSGLPGDVEVSPSLQHRPSGQLFVS